MIVCPSANGTDAPSSVKVDDSSRALLRLATSKWACGVVAPGHLPRRGQRAVEVERRPEFLVLEAPLRTPGRNLAIVSSTGLHAE